MRRTALLPLVLLAATACGSAGEQDEQASAPPEAPAAAATAPPAPPSPAVTTPTAPRPVLPGGGRSVFPEHTVVAYYGTVAGRGDLGVLGQGEPDAQAAALAAAAAPFGPASGRPVLPAFELITTVAQRAPGADGDYSAPIEPAQVQRYLDAARRAGALLILDLQPGTARFLDQAKAYEAFLREPDVGLALDPEWVLQPGQRPGRQIGSTTAAEVNAVSEYLQQLVTEGDLPQKVLVVHQFRASMLPDREAVRQRPGLEIVVHLDGFGTQGVKREVYDLLSLKTPPLRNGFKLFYDEDTDLMTPEEAMALVPRPELITYQ